MTIFQWAYLSPIIFMTQTRKEEENNCVIEGRLMWYESFLPKVEISMYYLKTTKSGGEEKKEGSFLSSSDRKSNGFDGFQQNQRE